MWWESEPYGYDVELKLFCGEKMFGWESEIESLKVSLKRDCSDFYTKIWVICKWSWHFAKYQV